MEDLILVPIDEDPSKIVKISSKLCEEDHRHLTSFLWANVDVFTWSASDIRCIDSGVIVHQLNMNPKHVRSNRRNAALLSIDKRPYRKRWISF